MLTTKSQPSGSDTTTCPKSASIVQREQLKFVSIPSGTLVKVLPEPSPIWLIIGGVRYGYTSWEKFTRFHKEDARVEVLADPDSVPEGTPFGDDLELITYENGPVFLLNNGRKRGFTSAEIFNQYQANWGKIHVYSAGVVAAIPEDAPLPG